MIRPAAEPVFAKTFPSVLTVLEEIRAADPRPWLVLGKGPTADFRKHYDFSKFLVVTLNHAALVYPEATLRHFVDVEALQDCVPSFPDEARVVLPWYPHRDCKPSKATLAEVARSLPKSLRYCSYQARSNQMPPPPWLPRLTLLRFSATAVFAMLTALHEETVYSLGVDGGTGYGKDFDPKDRLRNGQPSFDSQMAIIRNLCVPVVKTNGKVTRPRVKTHWVPLTAEPPAWCRR